MAKYKLVKAKGHICGGGINYRPFNEAWFLLECGHLVPVLNVNWQSEKRRCYECAGVHINPPSPMVLNALDETISSGVNELTWDDVDERLHPKKVREKWQCKNE